MKPFIVPSIWDAHLKSFCMYKEVHYHKKGTDSFNGLPKEKRLSLLCDIVETEDEVHLCFIVHYVMI